MQENNGMGELEENNGMGNRWGVMEEVQMRDVGTGNDGGAQG